MKRFTVVFSLTFFIVVAFATTASAKPSFKGNEGCKCHKSEQTEWAVSVHGKAFDSLLAKKRTKKQKNAMRKAKLDFKKDYDKDEKCLPCHVTGYDERGGYEDENSPEDLKGIGCEMCHGPGSEYRVLHKEKDETFTKAEAKEMGQVYGSEDENVCKKCHGHKDSPFKEEINEKYKFDYKEKIKLEKDWHTILPLKFKH